jgi:hypothetical protein
MVATLLSDRNRLIERLVAQLAEGTLKFACGNSNH